MAQDLDGAIAAAEKILGKDAKIPPPRPAVEKSHDDQTKAYDEYQKSRDDLKDKILALQDAVSSRKNALKQYMDEIEKSDFGLNEKSKDDAKKIKAGRKPIADLLTHNMTVADTNIKNLDELDKHMMAISKYKSPAP